MENIFEKKQIESAQKTTKEPSPAAKESAADGEIFDIQKERRGITGELRDQLKAIEKEEEIFWGARPYAKYHEEKKKFLVGQPNEETQIATLGDLITDASWGLKYNLDKTVPKDMKRTYVIETAKQKIANLGDKQLIIEQLSKEGVHPEQKRVYQAIRERTEKQFEHSTGLIFEKMTENLLTQLQHDLPDLGVKIKNTNVVKDVQYKVDFIIKVERHQRGTRIEEVGAEEIRKPMVLGIQFTLVSPEDIEKMKSRSKKRYLSEKHEIKLRQLEKAKKHLGELGLDDLLLIDVPTNNIEIARKYQIWKKLGKPVGGPERLYDTYTKIAILKALLQKMGIDDILENQEERLQEYYNSKLAPIE